MYYVVSEALANATKHSSASNVTVNVYRHGGSMRATITDDGIGGAKIPGSSGLIGLVDRIEALGGKFTLEAHPAAARRSPSSSLSTVTDPPTPSRPPF